MSDELVVVVWDVEHGSAAYAVAPNGSSLVLDAGASSSFSPATWLRRQHNVSSVNAFILSHADSDHIRDISEVDRLLSPQIFYRNRTVPRCLVYPTDPPVTYPLAYYDEFDRRYCHPVAPSSLSAIEQPANWAGVDISIWRNAPETVVLSTINDYSVVTVIRYRQLVVVFPGDLEPPGWGELMRQESFLEVIRPAPDSTRILVAAHHGHESGVYAPFLSVFQPHLTVVSDKYGSSHTAYQTYYRASLGCSVWDSNARQVVTRYVVSTKVNSFIRISSAQYGVTVSI